MYWETLPSWMWVIYYLILFITLSIAVFNIGRKRMLTTSILAIVISVITPIVVVLYSIGREAGVNEWEYLLNYIQQGDIWAIFILILHIYILAWLIFTLVLLCKRSKEAT